MCFTALLTGSVLAQIEQVQAIPLPDELASLPNELTIYSTPNPNIPVYTDKGEKVAWKHSTIIKADRELRVVETGAYLIYYGNWWKRASFNETETKEMFDAKSLQLNEGDSLIYAKNWRVEPWSRSGWNFWYVKAVDVKGDTLMGYDILYTAGILEDGSQVLPLEKKLSSIHWKGSGGENYYLEGTIEEFQGKVTYQNGAITQLSIDINLESMQHEIGALTDHLKSKDFFYTEKYPRATFTATKLTYVEDGIWEITGELCMRGKCNQEKWYATVYDKDTTIALDYEAEIDRTKYKVNYASTAKPDDNYSISDTISLWGRFEFRKDYPGSNPFNTLEAKEE